jgi:hypothetical protein
MDIGMLLRVASWIAGTTVVLFALDRVLLWAERRGWIYYRIHRPVRGASLYHLNELSQMLTGSGIPEVREEVQQDESGDPQGGHDAV